MAMKNEDLTQQIIGCFYTVYNRLGYGFLESVYQKALLIELQKQGLRAVSNYPITIFYDKQVVGEFSADLVVEECVIIELKAVRVLINEHEAQLLNYLNATWFEVGLLLNFGPQAQIKRKVFDNDRKKYLNSRMDTDKNLGEV